MQFCQEYFTLSIIMVYSVKHTVQLNLNLTFARVSYVRSTVALEICKGTHEFLARAQSMACIRSCTHVKCARM